MKITPMQGVPPERIKQDAAAYLCYLKERIAALFNISPHVELRFDLKGYRTLGQCKFITKNAYIIRLHMPLLMHYGEIYLEDVLTHEVAHAVQFALYHNRTKPHGKEWQSIMEHLEGKPYHKKHRPNYDTSLYQQTRRRCLPRYDYACGCLGKTHSLTAIRHNRIQKKRSMYFCKKCRAPLIFLP